MAGTDYVVDPTNVNSPIDGNIARKGSAELRALKAYIAGLAGLGTGINPFRKNIFTNGDLAIDQRNEGGGIFVAGPGVYAADRIFATKNALQTAAVQRQSLSKFPPLLHSILYNTSVAGVSGAAEGCGMFLGIPGYDIAQFGWGTAFALPLTLSMWMNSPVSGLHAISFRNSAGTRAYIATVNLVAGINQYCTFVIPGCPDGVWATDATMGIQVSIDLGSGTNYNAPASGIWSVGVFFRTALCVKVCETIGGMYIGGIQIEQGNAASPLEILSTYAEKLARNQEFCYKTFPVGTAPAQNVGSTAGAIQCVQASGAATPIIFERVLPIYMRVTPTLVTYNPQVANALGRNLVRANDTGAVANFNSSPLVVSMSCTSSAGSVSGDYNFLHVLAHADLF